MFYIVESSKSFYEAGFDLEPVVQRLGFAILHTFDFSETLRRKGIELDEDCQVFEICNYRYAEKMLSLDMRLSLTLPWRISIFTQNGATMIGLTRPDTMPSILGENDELARTAAEIEAKMIMIVDETR
ncbi:DUF302 domain-containing protein [Ferribacterium limneticum]|uniref:DUF302 domain-containing protein n=1 Tax=Ferribacterium limneticum TaxID=76259 RepID=UPI001CF946F7|nr:DUF302 domain-containing protein [Ferribacterium limneticum]